MALSSSGVVLDRSDSAFGLMRESNDILDDVEEQRTRMTEDGYLLFRDLIDADVVLEARREILLKMAIVDEIDCINHDVMDAIQSDRAGLRHVNMIALTESIRTGRAYSNVVLNDELVRFLSEFVGGSVVSFDFRWPRFVRPGESTGVHCDGPYITRATTNLWSCWIPLGDVPMVEGGLMILEGSHKSKALQKDYATKDADRENLGWLSTNPVELREQLGGLWLTTNYFVGDVLLFGPYLAHASLDNNSPISRCRLSSDTRYQLETEPLDERWNGDVSNPHGGAQRVFLPGLADDGNVNFTDEWKLVDERGRLTAAATAS
ncbi:phytanoyl-CoA dioxygenase family protein [Pseudonocardia sp. ICBG1293]|uniref:phytanoyl-CoA dioxygenase family protein n=1 Tax=Pseudonocardia sp. ICBG1293 TaxID=2844382 RepID=UPI001CCB9B60|nr:phytanoyl-CoA dioxygenase family protein [Pseudonocardia sp. ICBG1293]